MQMFDIIRCDEGIFPLAFKDRVFKTTNLYCLFSHYRIRSDGKLVDECFRYQKKMEAPDRPHYLANEGNDYKEWLKEWMEPITGPDRPSNYSGNLVFFDDEVSIYAIMVDGFLNSYSITFKPKLGRFTGRLST